MSAPSIGRGDCEPVGGVDDGRDELDGVVIAAVRAPSVGLCRWRAVPERDGILDQRVPPRLEHLNGVARRSFLVAISPVAIV